MNNNIRKAINFAALKHKDQVRKTTPLPYIVHPIDVMNILKDNNCDEDVIIAGILHDTIEDTQTTAEEILNEFGESVLNLVLSNSEDKANTWTERKSHTINQIPQLSLKQKQLLCADKLSNITSVYDEYLIMGDLVWDRFNSNKSQNHWYYTSIYNNLSDLSNYDMYKQLGQTIDLVFKK